MNPKTGDVWESEHGPMGGDEINIIASKVNYGWPALSLGKIMMEVLFQKS